MAVHVDSYLLESPRIDRAILVISTMTFAASLLDPEMLHRIVFGLLIFSGACFLARFLIPALLVGRALGRARGRLEQLKLQGPVLDLDQIRSTAMIKGALTECWDEYRDTLHGQKQANPLGMLEVSRWRATAIARGFFTEQAVVDAPVRSEFYKHLPGILTGIGIIGTFSGLVIGLQAFGQVDLGEPERARLGLKALLETVGGAFLVSGAAIALAMLVTFVEKAILNNLYTRLEKLCSVIDSLFDSGAGEEYLQRLVEASETSATQTMQMKESLVTELKQVLTELSVRQVEAMTSSSKLLGQEITSSLTDGLKEPLSRISDAVTSVSGNQGDAVNKLLTDVLSGFTSKMESMFGGQMRGMSEMLTQTASTIEVASQRFNDLANQIQQASSGATDALAKRMDEALAQMQAREAAAHEQMHAFIEQMKQSVAQGQSETAELTMSMMKELGESTGQLVKTLQDQSRSAQREQSESQRDTTQKLHEMLVRMEGNIAKNQSDSTEASGRMLRELGESTGALVKGLQEQMEAAKHENAGRQAALAEQTSLLLGQQSQQVTRLADALQGAEAAMRDTIARLKSTVDMNVDRMSVGAERLFNASDKLAGNLQLMKASSDGLSDSADRLAAASGVLQTSMTGVQQALSEQKAVRDSLAGMVSDFRSTMETAKRDAAVTSELVNRLQVASQTLVQAQAATVSNLEGATAAIAQAHGDFAKQVEVTLREGNSAFHKELSQATGLLKGAIVDLADVLDNIPTPA